MVHRLRFGPRAQETAISSIEWQQSQMRRPRLRREAGALVTFSDIGNIQVTRMTGATPAFNWLGVVIMNFILEDQADMLRQKLENEAKAALNESLANTIIPLTIN
ncbi:hypothetical protein MTO96_006881 [Rhipicephalus appendiculatus]